MNKQNFATPEKTSNFIREFSFRQTLHLPVLREEEKGKKDKLKISIAGMCLFYNIQNESGNRESREKMCEIEKGWRADDRSAFLRLFVL